MKEVMWTCPTPGHPDYPQRVSARTRQHEGCPKHRPAAKAGTPKRTARAIAKGSARQKVARVTAATTRPVVRPPRIDVELPIDLTEDAYTLQQVADRLGRPYMTIYNWTKQGRIRFRIDEAGNNRPRLVAVSECLRIAAILGVPEDGVPGLPTPLERPVKERSIVWSVAPEDRFGPELSE